MRKIIFTLLGFLLSLEISFADAGILGNFKGKDTEQAIRTGDIHTDDIPKIIRGMIDFFMSIAGTISIIFIIVGAYQILIKSGAQENTTGRKTIRLAVTGFALSGLAWFIIKLIIDNFN